MPGKMSNSFYFLYHNVLFAIEIPLNLPIQIVKVPKICVYSYFYKRRNKFYLIIRNSKFKIQNSKFISL